MTIIIGRSGIHSLCKSLIYCFTDVYSEGMFVYKIYMYAQSPLKTISILQTSCLYSLINWLMKPFSHTGVLIGGENSLTIDYAEQGGLCKNV